MKKENFDDIMEVVGGDQSVTYVTFIQDHSGSMGEKLFDENGKKSEISRAEFQRNNYNEQMAVLRRETGDMETLVTLIEFDDNVKIRYENVEAHEAIDLGDYWIGGMTALYDAIGRGIYLTQKKLDADQRENKAALVIIQTDGEENSSQEYKQKQLLQMIVLLEETKKWTFVFLGENIDKEIASKMSQLNTMQICSTVSDYKTSNQTLMGGLDKYYKLRKRGVTYSANVMSNDDETYKSKANAFGVDIGDLEGKTAEEITKSKMESKK